MKSVMFVALVGSISSATSAADRTVPAEQVPWAVEAPGQPQRLGTLWGHRATGPAGTLLRVPGRWNAPIHTHTADYRAIVVQGTWKHWIETGSKEAVPGLRPGSYWTQKAREWHADACISDSPCEILLINTEPYRTIVKKPK